MLQTFVASFVFAGFLSTAAFGEIKVIAERVRPAVQDVQILSSPDQVQLTGMLGARIDLNEQKRLLIVNEDELLEGFRNRPGKQAWVGEHIGKWLHAATLAWVYTGDAKLREKLDRVVVELLKKQQPDGYLGTYLENHKWKAWDVWVHKYDLLGLLAYYRYTGSEPALDACRKIGDLLCNTFSKEKLIIVKTGEHVGMAATSVLEPMVLLYRITGNQKYLDFCEYILWAWELPEGPKLLSSLGAGKGVNETANGKAYEMLSNLVGLCEMYRTTGRKELFPPVLNAWKDIVEKRLYITGSASQGEYFKADYSLPNDPKAHVVEACVTVTWMQLNLQLLRLTGEARFADQLERTVYNHLLSAQKATGEDWSYFTPLEGVKEYGHLGRSMSCCLSSGPRGMGLIPTFACTRDTDGIVVNLYEPGKTTLKLADGTIVTLEQQTLYPASTEAAIRIGLKQPKRFTIRFRSPEWAGGKMFLTQSRSMPDSRVAEEKGYQLRFGEWKDGDEIFIRVKTSVRVIQGQHTNQNKVALAWGPLVLGAADGSNPQAGGINKVSLPASAEALSFKPLPQKASLTTSREGGRWRVDGCKADAGGKPQPVQLNLMPFAQVGSDGSFYQVWFAEGCKTGEKAAK